MFLMLAALPSIDRTALFDRLAAGEGGITVVTSSRRLAQHLLASHDALRAARGARAWESADILPWRAFVDRFMEDARHSDFASGLPLPLSTAQEQVLWEDCVRASHGSGLMSVPAAADAALAAWSLAHAWRLAAQLARSAMHDDARAFVEWSARYERLTRERNQTDRARLPDVVAPLLRHEALRKPLHIVLAGFELITPQQAEFFERLRALAVGLESLASRETEAHPVRVSFASEDEELAAAARWARGRVESGATRVGIVVPALSRSRRRVERIFMRAMDPGRSVATARSILPFNISLGGPLTEWPACHDALAWLRLAGRDMAFEDASGLMRSPFIAGAEGEHAVRAELDAALRRRAGARVSLDALVRLVDGEGLPRAPQLSGRLRRLAEFRRSDLFARRGAAEWARALDAALGVLGFPGERALDSVEHQVVAKWHDALGELASLERVSGRMGYSDACELLARICARTLFQPETPAVPVQVVGLLEAAGLEFDHLWVTGLTDEDWPLPPAPNPFIPLALQRAAGIPHADADAGLALDVRITASWSAAAGEVVFSHARMHGENDVDASPLVAGVPECDTASLGLDAGPGYVEALHASRTIESIADRCGPPVDAAQRRGGTRLFRDQAACPFRAFARHRLRVQALERPQPGLDAAARGTLLHEMMRIAWSALEEKGRLDVAGDDLQPLLETCADQAIASQRRRHHDALSGRFAALERERLVTTAREWLEIERARPPFRVLATEEKRELEFGGIAVRVTLDRLDALEGGGSAIIDYKTGAAAVSAWLGARPDEPQLPMYALGSGEDVRALAFARLKRGEMQFCGLATAEGLLPKVRTIESNRSRNAGDYRDWPALVAGWRDELEKLGREFARGEAWVRPKYGAQTCAQCEQQPLCRVAEKRPQSLDIVPAIGNAADE